MELPETYYLLEPPLDAETEQALKEEINMDNQEEDNLCECGKPMVVRTNSQTGQQFWGCTGFPECTNTEPLDDEPDGDCELDYWDLID